jgi:hypothetical protein
MLIFMDPGNFFHKLHVLVEGSKQAIWTIVPEVRENIIQALQEYLKERESTMDFRITYY